MSKDQRKHTNGEHVSNGDVGVIYHPRDDSEKSRCKCFGKSCCLGVVVILYVLVDIPFGILLLTHGWENNYIITKAIGCLLIGIPPCIIFPSIVLCKWRQYSIKDKIALMRTEKKGYENPMSTVLIGDEDL